MLYDIQLTINYNYGGESDHLRNILRLLPSSTARQRVAHTLLTIRPGPDERRDSVDFFGNITTQVAWHRPVDHLSITLRARAERFAFPELDLSAPLAGLDDQIATQGLLAASPLHFCSISARIADHPQISDFAQAAVQEQTSTRAAVQALGRALHSYMTFDADATDVTTAPETAFAARRGVCQDYAQIMIAGLRGVGIPAAYISGFLRTNPPAGMPRLAGVDAMHAWIAAWCGADQGWVEYDPTNCQWAGEDYITVAWGRDYADAAPVRGTMRTAGAQTSGHKVDVIPLIERS
jgi:transglutaminase-like putative cysteine protease